MWKRPLKMQISDCMRGVFFQNGKLTVLGKKMAETCIVLPVNPGKK